MSTWEIPQQKDHTPHLDSMTNDELEAFIKQEEERIHAQDERLDELTEMVNMLLVDQQINKLREDFPDVDLRERLSAENVHSNQEIIDGLLNKHDKSALARACGERSYTKKLQPVLAKLAWLKDKGSHVLEDDIQPAIAHLRKNFWAYATAGAVSVGIDGFQKSKSGTTTYDYSSSLSSQTERSVTEKEDITARPDTVNIKDYIDEKTVDPESQIEYTEEQQKEDVILEETQTVYGGIAKGIRNTLYNVAPASIAGITSDIILKNILRIPVSERDITEEQLSSDELAVLKKTVKNALQRKSQATSYTDYPENARGISALQIVNFDENNTYPRTLEGLKKITHDVINDPVTNTVLAFGKSSLHIDENNHIILTDNYDVTVLKNSTGNTGVYNDFRMYAQPLFSQESPDGEPVEKPMHYVVNLGPASELVDNADDLDFLPTYRN